MTAARVRQRERPIHERDIDLTDLVTGGVDDVHARQEAELNGLLRRANRRRR